jgi:hypothetical protein
MFIKFSVDVQLSFDGWSIRETDLLEDSSSEASKIYDADTLDTQRLQIDMNLVVCPSLHELGTMGMGFVPGFGRGLRE